MRLPILSFAVFMALGTAPAVSAQQWLPENLGRWTAAPPVAQVQASLSSDLAKETGLNMEARDYTSGANRLHVVLQKYRDPTSAYEGYTAQLTPSLLPSSLGITSAVEKGKFILILVGNLVLRVEKPMDVNTEELRLLITTVQKHREEGPYPPVRSYLPEDGLVEGTQRYTLGPAGFRNALDALQLSSYYELTSEVGFDSGAEAMLAAYHTRKESGTLVLIEYPTPQLAEQHLHHLETVLPESAIQGGAKVERRTSLLSLVLGSTSAAYAEALRHGVNYETEVTWNEPTHSLTDPPWISVLKTIFLGTVLFCGVAIVLGIAFGGFRILVKRLLPGKVFDRPGNLEILQLGLSGKPIDPKDLY
jgi:Family of unknown function (DUF6599)